MACEQDLGETGIGMMGLMFTQYQHLRQVG